MSNNNYRALCGRLRVLLIEKRQEINALNNKIKILENQKTYLLEQRDKKYTVRPSKFKFEDIPTIRSRKRKGAPDSPTVIHGIVFLLNRILDKGLINSTDFEWIPNTSQKRYVVKMALKKHLIRYHNVKLVSFNHRGVKKTRKVYTITRAGIRFAHDFREDA